MKRYVLYHANCCDGFGAALVARRWAGADGVFIPCVYGDPLPAIEDGAQVAIVDFSFPREVLLALAARVKSLLVLDHHKTAQEELAGLPFVVFDMNKSGAMLAWESFHTEAAPALIRYIQDRDLWRFALPKSREINAALRSYPFDFQVWARFFNGVERLAPEGAAILRAVDQQVAAMCKEAVEMVIGGHAVPCVNATVNFSEVGDELCRQSPERPFSAHYFDRADGKRQFGLRSRGEFDVSAVAKLYGGGGHKGAAGFVIDVGRIRELNVVKPREEIS